jgi:shikimate kinase
MNWILFGFKNCGKTTLGKILAARLNRAFIDTDQKIEELYVEKLSYRKIYEKVGELEFRKMESTVLEQLEGIKDTIIAVGGGVVLSPSNVSTLAKLGPLIYLKLSKETLRSRTLGEPLPAYLNPKDAAGSFEIHYNGRLPRYEEIDAFSIDLEKKTQNEIIQEITHQILTVEVPLGK